MTTHKNSSMAMGRWIALGAMLAASCLLSGCAFSNNSSSTGSGVAPASGVHISGKVYGGQQPVSGSTIQLYTVGTLGPASTSTPLLTTTVTTNSSGQFSIAGDFACTSASEVYLVATGGNAGSGNNAALSMMAVAGTMQLHQFVHLHQHE